MTGSDFERAHRKLAEIRERDPDLADAIEHEARARGHAMRAAIESKAGFSANRRSSYHTAVEALAMEHVKPRPGDIVREGTVGGRLLDGSIVIGSMLLSARLDEMVQARPLGLKPSTIKALLEVLVLAIALLKRSRRVSRYAALSLTGTVGGKLLAASARGAPSP